MKEAKRVGQWTVLWDAEDETLHYWCERGERGYIDRHAIPGMDKRYCPLLTKETAVRILRSMPETKGGEAEECRHEDKIKERKGAL